MTSPGRAASPLDSLAPDQRAALELVVRQGRSYGELAGLLGIPEADVRARAHSALEALAPDLPPPADAGELADFLLGQQDPGAAEGTRARLAGDAGAQRWVMTVAAPLGELKPPAAPPSAAATAAAAAAGELAAIEDVDVPTPRTAAPPARPRPLRRGGEAEPAGDPAATGGGRASPPAATAAGAGVGADGTAAMGAGPVAGDSAAATGADGGAGGPAATAGGAAGGALPPAAAGAASAGRSSRLGGAVLIGAAVVLVAAVLVFVLTRGGDHKPAASAATTPKPTATSSADQLQPTDVVMTGPAGSKAVGLMRLFTASDNNLHFLLAGQNLPPNRGKEHYALWFLKKGAAPRWLGFARYSVGKDGALAMTGPRAADLKRFPAWFTSYDTVQVTDDGPRRASRPGTVILSGPLPKTTR
jgi:hypothetical protein